MLTQCRRIETLVTHVDDRGNQDQLQEPRECKSFRGREGGKEMLEGKWEAKSQEEGLAGDWLERT